MPAASKPNVAVACQGGGSHAAFAAGVLIEILQPRHAERFELVALSGASGGAVCAVLAWSGLIRPGGGLAKATELLAAFWDELSPHDWWDAATNFWAVWGARLPITWEISPYLVYAPAEPRLRSLLEKHVALDELPRAREARRRPALFLGATDIRHGGGVAFGGDDLTYDDIIASAAVPPLFRAVHARGTLFWDGLFGRNPPIREFTDLEERPDEIWIVRINPAGRDVEPMTMPEIVDRRNELSGNLALDQELFFIKKINDLRAECKELQDRYKHVEVREVGLDLDLDYPSKLDRDADHVRRLLRKGRERAPLFFADGSSGG